MKKYLIVGLGNPGVDYVNTRHNIGFQLVDAWSQASTFSFKPDRYADRAEINIKGRTLVFIKPQTFMNLSGKAVRYWLNEEKVPLSNLLVLVDEIALPLGHVRLKLRGSDGGHNGLKDIQEVLGRQDYARLRFGIGQDFAKGQQIQHVLGAWHPDESKAIEQGIERAIEQIKTFVLAGPQLAMTQFNQ